MIMNVDGSGAISQGVRIDWGVVGPAMAVAIVLALGVARFWPARRTRKIAYVLAAAAAIVVLLGLLFGFEGWPA